MNYIVIKLKINRKNTMFEIKKTEVLSEENCGTLQKDIDCSFMDHKEFTVRSITCGTL